ncbi:MAG: hypothetical protein HZB46_17020 [Solirubrobacterales bacterium]|nr:hypothetical protein [Solirubrobacterales bacterium]
MRRALGLGLLAASAVAAAGCGAGDGARDGALLWSDGPRTTRLELKPQDRIVGGRIRNDSLRPMDVLASSMRAVDARGHRVKASITFAVAPGHPLWPTGRVNLMPVNEQLRTGMRARLKPGEESSLVVAWHHREGQQPPVRLLYDGGSLPLRVPST